jgi:rubrerythrin
MPLTPLTQEDRRIWMSFDFNADEIFEMAMQIERNGVRFYRLAAEGTIDPNDRQLLLELATMEQDHERTFAEMKDALATSEKLSATFDPYGEGASYLRAMANGNVFDVKADPHDFFSGQKSREDILRKAIDLEKDSIVFYLGMRDMVPPRLGRDKVEHIIREEMRHIVSLNRKLTAPPDSPGRPS